MTSTSIKTRFCPSPTGLMHLGNARTALFNALLAGSLGGNFLLRIEDTDQSRSKAEYVTALQEDLRWLGIDWTEGPECEANESQSYFQSERAAIYNQYYDILIQQKQAYPCFCSEANLEIVRKSQRAQGLPPRYPGTCTSLSQVEIEAKLAQDLKPTLRFRVPRGQVVSFNDLVKGQQRFNTDDLGDFIIRRTDGTAPFLYCNAIDDALMGVTHAMRGDDHLTNTPRQLLILQALHLPTPSYGHFALITSRDSNPLSKREGSWSIQAMRQAGYLPSAIINYLARLGHNYVSNEFMDFAMLAKQFKLSALSRSPARFDITQLKHWQKVSLEHIDDTALWAWMGTKVHDCVPAELRAQFIAAIRPNVLMPEDALHWAEILFKPLLVYSEAILEVLAQAGECYLTAVLGYLSQEKVELGGLVAQIKKLTGTKGRHLFLPLRAVLTNELHGPELPLILHMLGQEQIKIRFSQALLQVRAMSQRAQRD